MVVEWAERWYHSDEGPVMEWTHVDCGAPFKGVLTCDQCGKAVKGSDIDLTQI